jgi:hypothetical protein
LRHVNLSGVQRVDVVPHTLEPPRGNAAYVTGTSIAVRTHRDIATVVYNATTGAPLWVSRFDGDRKDDIATALAVSPNGASVIVAGSSGAGTTSTQSYRFLVLAYGAVSGTKLWSTRLLTDSSADDTASAVVVSPNDRTVFATGHKNHVMTTVAIRL